MSTRTIDTHGPVTLIATPFDDDQAFVTVSMSELPDASRAAEAAYDALGRWLGGQGMEVVHERAFGSLDAAEAVQAARRSSLSAAGLDADRPVTYVQGRPIWGSGLAGLSVLAVRGERPEDVWTVRDGAGSPRGRGWSRHGTRFLCLQNLHGRSDADENTREAQADRMFDRADAVLRGQDADYRNVARTWLYLSKILDWYGDFNAVRNAKYSLFGLMPEAEGSNGRPILLPASTGIEGDAPTSAAATMDLLATVPSEGTGVSIEQMTNRKQKDAFKYGSAFSRGAAIGLPKATWISISGTASIDEAGVSLHVGDFRAQMNLTLDTVEALIAQKGASLNDLCDMTCFLKRAEDADAYREILAERGLADLPAVLVEADVCRDDLLFEMDGAAVARG